MISAIKIQELRRKGYSIAAARALLGEQAASSYGEADIHATLDVCQLAGAPIKAVSAFIKAKTPVAAVREAMLSARAQTADRLEVGTVLTSATPSHLAEWKELQARVKAEMGIGRRI
jgi:hypothetical protein